MKIIPDGKGGFLTLTDIVEIVNSRPQYNIKRDDLLQMVEAEITMQPIAAPPKREESADYWRGKYDALKEIVEFTDGDT